MSMERLLIGGGVVLLAAVAIFFLTRKRFVLGGGLGLLAVGSLVFLLTQTYPGPVCKPGPVSSCNIPVSVSQDCTSGPAPDSGYDTVVALVGKGAANIFWHAPAGFTFNEPDGIKFKNNNGDITQSGSSNLGAVWHVVDTPSHPLKIQYQIELKRTSDGKICTGPDPVIWNY